MGRGAHSAHQIRKIEAMTNDDILKLAERLRGLTSSQDKDGCVDRQTTRDAAKALEDQQAEIICLRAALYDQTEGITGTLPKDSNESILKLARETFPPKIDCHQGGGATFVRDSDILAFAKKVGNMRLEEAASVCKGRAQMFALAKGKDHYVDSVYQYHIEEDEECEAAILSLKTPETTDKQIKGRE